MRFFLPGSFLLILYSCVDKEKKDIGTASIPKEYLTPLLDSFNTRNLDIEPSLQYDIALDTIEICGDLRHPYVSAIFPKLSETDYSFVRKQIAKLIKDKKTDFYQTISGYKIENDSGWVERSCDIRIRPVSLYQTDKVISFALETNRDYLGMSTAFEYDVINYDLENKKPIALLDYFALNTSADTSFLEQIIGRAAGIDFSIKNHIEIGGHINFSFDDLYVYFYFDKYDMAWGAKSVKKKYILDHIHPDYRQYSE